MVDAIGVEAIASTRTARWRGLASLNPENTTKKHIKGDNSKESEFEDKLNTRPNVKPRDSDLIVESDIDISLIHRRTYLLSAGIGDTNKQYNNYKGKFGLVLWIINICIHFGLDFYEANTIFDISWATCIGLFLVTLVACCISMIKHSVPWFLKGVKKLKKDGHYPKTLKRVRLIVRFMPLIVSVFAVGAAVGQFGCYWADGALKVNFNPKNASTALVSSEVETFLNVVRATSLIHIFYGFCSLLVFHMTLIFMLQSSMQEYNERMGKLFREVPISICFSDAVNLFSARAKFVRDGSQKSSIVLTTLLVACCTSFVLNAYNFLFLKKYAIYIWFALAPLIWAVVPLMGAAWVTNTYWHYKLVVVNAWVDIPDEQELESRVYSAIHHSHSAADRIKTPVRRMWGSIVGKAGKKDVDKNDKKEKNDEGNDEVQPDKLDEITEPKEITENKQIDDKKSELSNGQKNPGNLATRRNSEVVISFSSKSNKSKQCVRRFSSSVNVPNKTPPKILLTDFDVENVGHTSPKPFRTMLLSNKVNEGSLVDSTTKENTNSIDGDRAIVQVHRHRISNDQNHDVHGLGEALQGRYKSINNSQNGKTKNTQREVCINIEPTDDDETESTHAQGLQDVLDEASDEGVSNLGFSRSYSSSSLSSSDELSQELEERNSDLIKTENNEENSATEEYSIPKDVPGSYEMGSAMSSLRVPGELQNKVPQSKPNFLTGISKTFHKWRTKTKKKKKFNYEKYIIYLESILPTVGFSVGGVIIDWNGIYTFIVIMTFLVGVFAQEAFFGN